MWKNWRNSGVLLHPTSLPGPYGLGEIGPEAYRFADVLNEMGQGLWQMLPLGPTSYGDSPYQSPSTFAGNHLLISLDLLVKDGLLSPDKPAKLPEFPLTHVDYGWVIPERMQILRSVCRTFSRKASEAVQKRFNRFCRHNAYWLDDYALFMAIKEAHGNGPFVEWPTELIRREETALAKARTKYKTPIRDVKIMQFLFHDQWERLRKYCAEKGVQIVGDIPIFVAHDSADVWAHPELFYVDEDTGRLQVQAGVPPDYFSATGQLWGNPLYRWEAHQSTGYAWWMQRLRKVFEMVDIVRIDHFRGFEAYWEVPADAENAINGQWVKGPNHHLFTVLRDQMGTLPIIAEDLGVITPEVERLRDDFELPGMNILQFAFGNDEKAEAFRPHNYKPNSVAYTGTHDNDTTVGWFNSQPGPNSTRSANDIARERATVLDYLRTSGDQIEWDMISLASRSQANTAIAPLQDIMGLGSEARMNTPGKPDGNWQWRFSWDMLPEEKRTRLRAISTASDRIR
ncbi:MAG: 4-alpha-glucanotransferase [Kiritimatiellae bacterium]|nr:4-alpha-glucanotransferase [Kiritimatiellia bacterium]